MSTRTHWLRPIDKRITACGRNSLRADVFAGSAAEYLGISNFCVKCEHAAQKEAAARDRAQDRTSGRKPKPYVSVGSDRSRAETVIKDAVARGLLDAQDSQARGVLTPAPIRQLADGSECDGVTHFVRIAPGDEWPQGAFRLAQCKCPPRKVLPGYRPERTRQRNVLPGSADPTHPEFPDN